MFSEERSHISSHLAVRTKDRSGLQCFVLLDKFEFRASQLSTNRVAAMWRATVECTAARQQFSLLVSLVPFETTRPGSSDCKQCSPQACFSQLVKIKSFANSRKKYIGHGLTSTSGVGSRQAVPNLEISLLQNL